VENIFLPSVRSPGDNVLCFLDTVAVDPIAHAPVQQCPELEGLASHDNEPYGLRTLLRMRRIAWKEDR
jgi:hypothetical protein